MTIVRDGKEIELTKEEVRKAYEEEMNSLDREDIETVIDYKKIEVTDEEFARILDTYEGLKRHDERWFDNAEWAINEEMGTW